MGFIKNLFRTIFQNDEYYEEDERLWDEDYFWQEDRSQIGQGESDENESDMESDAQWDWDTITNERTFLKISDPYQREKLIRSLVEQVKNALRVLKSLTT